MYNISKEFAGLYLKAVDIMKKLEHERTEYEKRVLEAFNKYSLVKMPGFLSKNKEKEK